MVETPISCLASRSLACHTHAWLTTPLVSSQGHTVWACNGGLTEPLELGSLVSLKPVQLGSHLLSVPSLFS